MKKLCYTVILLALFANCVNAEMPDSLKEELVSKQSYKAQVEFYNDKGEQIFANHTYVFKCKMLSDFNIYETEHISNGLWVKDLHHIGHIYFNEYGAFMTIGYDFCGENADGTLSSLKDSVLLLEYCEDDGVPVYKGDAVFYILPATARDKRDIIRKETHKAVVRFECEKEDKKNASRTL